MTINSLYIYIYSNLKPDNSKIRLKIILNTYSQYFEKSIQNIYLNSSKKKYSKYY